MSRNVATALVWERGMTGAVRGFRRELRDIARDLRAVSRTPAARVWFKLSAGLAGMALLVVLGPRWIGGCESRLETTRLKIRRYVYEAYPSWSASHPDRECPASLDELDDYMNASDSQDAWGRSLELHGGAIGLPRPHRLWVRSAGEDGRLDTRDDLDNLQ
jgi:hypothetical protein